MVCLSPTRIKYYEISHQRRRYGIAFRSEVLGLWIGLIFQHTGNDWKDTAPSHSAVGVLEGIVKYGKVSIKK